MAKTSDSTRPTYSRTAAASRTTDVYKDRKGIPVKWATQEDVKGLPKGWDMKPEHENTYRLNVDISSNVRHSLHEIHPDENFSFGSWDKGSSTYTSVECKSVDFAKNS